MAAPPFPHVCLETMETAENKGEEPDETGDASVDGLPERQHPQRILGSCWKWNPHAYHYK